VINVKKPQGLVNHIVLLLILILQAVNYKCPGQGVKDTVSSNLKWEFYRLDNGLRVLLQPDLDAEEISVEFWIHSGLRDEVKGKYGLAHFFEHATPYGLQDCEEELTRLRSAMTNSNAQTRHDYIRYFIQVKPEVLNLALKYTADRLKSDTSSITEASIERHRSNVLAEIQRNSVYPFWAAEAKMIVSAGTFGKNHPYGHGGYGTIQENEIFSLRDVREWYDKYVFPGNTILFVVGNFTISDVKDLVESHFKNIHQKSSLPKSSIPEPACSGEEKSINLPTENHCISLTWPSPEWGSDDEGALRILANIIDQRLANNINDQLHSVVEAESSYLLNFYEHAGQFGVYATFSALRDSGYIQAWLIGEIDKLISGGIADIELKKALETEIETTREMMAELAFGGSRTELLGEGALFKSDPGFYLKRLSKQKELSISDIKLVSGRYLGKKPLRLLVISTDLTDP
jgi:zinc protease